MKRLALAVVVLLAVVPRAYSDTYSINVQLSDITTQFLNSPQNNSLGQFAGIQGVVINEDGTYKVPTLDPSKFSLTGISFALTGKIGGSAWTEPIALGEEMLATISTTVQMFAPGAPFYIFDSESLTLNNSHPEVLGLAHVSIYDSAPMNGYNGLLPSEFQSGSVFDSGGYVPFTIDLNVAASGYVVEISPPPYFPSVLAFIVGPVLEVTYTFDPLGGYDVSDLPPGDSSQGPVRSNYYLNDFGGPLPESLGIPPEVQVPEPSSLALGISAIGTLMASYLGLSLSRRK